MSIGTFLVVAAIVLAVGVLVAWNDRKTRRRNRQGDAISPHYRFAYREFEGRSSAQVMNAGATVVRLDPSGATDADRMTARIEPERAADGDDAA